MAKTKKKTPPPLAAADEKPSGSLLVSLDDCAPNDWNPNTMTQETRDKLRKGILALRDQALRIPPIVVRPHPDQRVARWQIIDGYHRWDIFREEGLREIEAFVIDVDTKMAMVLTDTLNYLRGDPDPDKYASYLHRLLQEGRMSTDDAAELLPMTSDEIQTYLDTYDLHVDKIEVLDEDAEVAPNATNDDLMELKFSLRREQVEVVEAEIARIAAVLSGKNVRGRALEFMAVSSSQTPMESITGQPSAEEEVVPRAKQVKLKDVKKRLKEVSRVAGT